MKAKILLVQLLEKDKKKLTRKTRVSFKFKNVYL